MDNNSTKNNLQEDNTDDLENSLENIFVVNFELINKKNYIESKKSIRYWMIASEVIKFVENELPEIILKNNGINFKKMLSLKEKYFEVVDGTYEEEYQYQYEDSAIECNYLFYEKLLIFKNEKSAKKFNQEFSKYILDHFDKLEIVMILKRKERSKFGLKEAINFELFEREYDGDDSLDLKESFKFSALKLKKKIDLELLPKKLEFRKNNDLENFGAYQKCKYTGLVAGYVDSITRDIISKEYYDLNCYDEMHLFNKQDELLESIKTYDKTHYALVYFDGNRILKLLRDIFYKDNEHEKDDIINDFFKYIYEYVDELVEKKECKSMTNLDKLKMDMNERYYFIQNYDDGSKIGILKVEEIADFIELFNKKMNINFIDLFFKYKKYEDEIEEKLRLKLYSVFKNLDEKIFYNRASIVIAEKNIPFNKVLKLTKDIISAPNKLKEDNIDQFCIDMEIATTKSICHILSGESKSVHYELSEFMDLKSIVDSVKKLEVQDRTNENIKRKIKEQNNNLDSLMKKQIYQLLEIDQEIEHKKLLRENDKW